MPDKCPECNAPTKGNVMTTSMGAKVCKSCGYHFTKDPVSNPPNLPQY